MREIESSSDIAFKKLMELRKRLNIAYNSGMSNNVIQSLELMINEIEEELFVTEQTRYLKQVMSSEKEVITDPLPDEVSEKPALTEKNPLRKKFNMPSFNKRFRDANTSSDIVGTGGENTSSGFDKDPKSNNR